MATNKKTAVILGISADIGHEICKRLLVEGYYVIGTYRNLKGKPDGIRNLKAIQCDLLNHADKDRLVRVLADEEIKWDLFFSSVGTTEPIGNFFELDFEEWKRCFELNIISQLEILHKIHPYRNLSKADVIFMAGGGH